MSKLLLLCIVVVLCVTIFVRPAPAPASVPIGKPTQPPSQESQQSTAAQNPHFGTALASGPFCILQILRLSSAFTSTKDSSPAAGWYKLPSRALCLGSAALVRWTQAIKQNMVVQAGSLVDDHLVPVLFSLGSRSAASDRDSARLQTLAALRERGLDYAFLSHWSHAELLDLMTWLNRGIWFEGDWTSQGLRTALRGLRMTLAALDGDLNRVAAVLGISVSNSLVYRVCAVCYKGGSHYTLPWEHQVTFDSNPDLVSFLHETGHVVDYYLARGLETGSTWWSEVGLLGLGWSKQVHQSGEAGVYYLDSQGDAAHSEYSPSEDFADTYAAWVLAANGVPLPRGWRRPSGRRLVVLAAAPHIVIP